jgi:hypothetical protein
MARCEDAPCCGHGNDGCNDDGRTVQDYLTKFSNPNYDPYYDESDY